MHQLANAVVIFDEIQTLPISCVHLFNNAVNFLVEQCGATVVLCTATQPLLGNVSADYGALPIGEECELVPSVDTYFAKLRRVEVIDQRKPGGWTNEAILQLAADEVSASNSCLVVVNTKESAATLRSMWGMRDGVSAYHLSTSMCPAHRADVFAAIRRDLLDSTVPVACFSTQLVEAGVDIDFGSGIRLLAGLDSIAQAAGRCNRHGRRKSGRLHIVNPLHENLANLPDIRVGRNVAERVLDDYRSEPTRFDDNIIGPTAIREYYQFYFYARQNEMSYNVSAAEIGHDDTVLSMLSVNGLAVQEHKNRFRSAPTTYFRQAFMTASNAFRAIDSPTRGIVVPFGEE